MGTSIRFVDNATTWQILFYRSLGMIFILLIYVFWQSKGHAIKDLKNVGLPGVTAAISLVLAFAGSIYAFQSTSIANAAFIFACAPFLTAILAWPLLKEPIRKNTWWALLLSIIGVLIMVSSGLSFSGLKGNLAALISALGFAGFTISLRWGKLNNMTPAIILGGIFSIFFAMFILLANQNGLVVSISDAIKSIAMGIFLLGGGMVLFSIGSKVLTATNLALLSMVEVVLAPVWGWLILREQAEFSTLLGGGILFFALILNAFSGVRKT
jgi:drug/metabolite transporter (DMT)-like permease